MKARIVRPLAFVVVILAAGLAARPQRRELSGTPLIRQYDIGNDFGGTQAWTLLQDRNGFVYAGMSGPEIGQYDGSTARTISIPVGTARRLEMDSHGKIWAGLAG